VTPQRRKSPPVSPLHEKLQDGILVRHCHGLEEFGACVRVERAVWQSADIDIVPIPLFVVAAETGGQVLGAFDGDKIIGFTLAIAGWRDWNPFLHSHMTAVLEPHRDRGVGRRLKLFQREDALARGISRIEWTFDPLLTKNAYLNFMRLGAIARRYLPNAYGATTSPLHAALPTDRLVAEWHLRSARVRRILSGKRATRPISKNSVRIQIPAAIDSLKKNNPAGAVSMHAAIRDQFLHWLNHGYAATAVARNSSGVQYILEPWKNS
jgi:predicted GNAT superfamily acetyltransferase